MTPADAAITPAPLLVRPAASKTPNSMVESFNSSDDESKQRCCFNIRGRGRRTNPKEQNTKEEDNKATVTSPVSAVDPKGAAAAAAKNLSPKESESKKNSPKVKPTPNAKVEVERLLGQDPETPAAEDAAPKPQCDTAERHNRRLDLFLDEVKRNPQRLVTHIDRRRAEKTHLAYIVM